MINFLDNAKYICNLKGKMYEQDNGEYIIAYDELRMILNDICNKLRRPITAININYEWENYMESCVDSDASYYALRSTCRNFRVAAGEEYCRKCDKYYAHYCKDLIENSACYKEPLDYFSEICKNDPPELQYNGEREYLVYNCPMLGYCEMCFPIYFKKRIIGFLVVGEVLLEDGLKIKNEIAEAFFNKHSDFEQENNIFRNYLQLSDDINKKNFIKQYMQNEINIQPMLLKDFNRKEQAVSTDFKTPLSNQDFKELINMCCYEIEQLESLLENRWRQKKKENFKTTISNIIENFEQEYSQIIKEEQISYNNIQNMFDIVCKSIGKLLNIYDFNFCKIYANLSNISRGYFEKTIGECPTEFSCLSCDFSRLRFNMTNCVSSLKKQLTNNPLMCFNDEFGEVIDEKENVVLACENLIVLFNIKNKYLQQKYYDLNIQILFKEIEKLFTCLNANFERISIKFIQQQHEKTLHMYRHECAHLAQRIQQNNKYYSDRERYEFLSVEKKENISRDINSTALLLQHLSTNIGLLLGSINNNVIKLDNSFVDVRDEINKWRAMFRLELKKKKLKLYNATAPIDFNLRFDTHNELFGIMLFNLIDNAVKYAHWGTTIYTDVTPEQIIIKNYGVEIEEGSRPYDLYYRDKKNVHKKLGDGIGLYSSKKIADILNIELYHTCEKISDFNLAFVKEALERNLHLNKMDIDVERATLELKHAIRSNVLTPDDYYEFGRSYYHISDDVIIREIKQPTYCVKFIVNGLNEKKEW